MVSPEWYYEENLKGKTSAQIREIVGNLKMGLRRFYLRFRRKSAKMIDGIPLKKMQRIVYGSKLSLEKAL